MFGKGVTLFKLFGFRVRVDASWLLIVVLVIWSLGAGLFPRLFEGFSRQTYWLMGVLGALGLFASIVVHELSHSLVARRFDLPIKGITLFVFGGVAEMEEEPSHPAAEFWMAIAGPITSVFIAVCVSLVAFIGWRYDWPLWLTGTLGWLGFINFLLAAFNMVPAFPLDGGRVLRSALWYTKHNLKWATRVASAVGSGFGVLLIVLGVLIFLRGDFLGGMWLFLIGMFVRHASRMSYQQLMIRRALEGEPVRRFMQREVHSVPAEATLSEFVDDYVYRYHHKLFPVTENGDVRGCLGTSRLKEIPRSEWGRKRVGDVLEPCSEANMVGPDADAMKTLMRMSRNGSSRLMVVEDGTLLGIISLKDLVRFISLKLEIEEDVQSNDAPIPAAAS
jgi:Zn-dependent protease